jgi:hypothetical protein
MIWLVYWCAMSRLLTVMTLGVLITALVGAAAGRLVKR